MFVSFCYWIFGTCLLMGKSVYFCLAGDVGSMFGFCGNVVSMSVFPKNRGTPKWMVYNGKPY